MSVTSIQGTCKLHGLTLFYRESKTNNRYRCGKCNAENVSKRRQKLKAKAIEYKGGCCSRCGYLKSHRALEFHHTNGDKEFSISKVGTISWERLKVELDKCVLVCANCHREIHEELDA